MRHITLSSSLIVSLVERNTSSGSDEVESGSRLSVNRRKVLASAGSAVLGVGAIGAFSGTAAAWTSFDVEFKGCTSVWIIVDEEDLDWEENYPHRTEPLFVKVVVERGREAVCEKVEFTEENVTRVPGQYGDNPLVKFDGGDKMLAVIKYNDDDIPFCYVENDNQCAQTPDTPDWKDADCYDELGDEYQLSCDDYRGRDPEEEERGGGRSGN